MKNNPAYIIVHHTFVSRDKSDEQYAAVDAYHRAKGWGGIGYHYFVEPDGTRKKGRAEDVVGAHCKAADMNMQSIGICLAGNFDIENPTEEQLRTLRDLVRELRRTYDIPIDRVRMHRHYAPDRSCAGLRFTDQMLSEVAEGYVVPFTPPAWARPGIDWCREHGIITQITGEPIPDYRLAAILHNFATHIYKH